MALTVGQLNVKLAIDVSQFNQQLSRIDSQMSQMSSQGANGFKSIQSSATDATGALSGLGSAASIAGAALAGAAVAGAAALGATLTRAIGTAATFEHQMSAINAVMQPNAAQFDALSAKARELGASTSFSATEAAAGIEMLAKNGVSYDDIMNGVLDSTLALAAATGSDLALSADIATDVMAAFGMEASQMTTVVDGITGVLQASKFSIDDYKLALANGGAAVASFGVPLDDFNAVIAATSSQFASGQTAGTAFRTFVTRLTPSTKTATEAMQELGIITADGVNQFYDSSGALKDMSEVIKILQSTMGGLSEEELASKVEEIFGAEALGTVIGLLHTTDEEFKAVQATIANASAADQAKERLNNLQGALTILRSALEGAAIALGTPFLEPLTALVQGVSGGISTFTQFADSILRADNPLQALLLAVNSGIPGFHQLTGVLAPLGAVFTGVIVPALSQVANIVSTATLPLLARLGAVFNETFVSNATAAIGSFSGMMTTLQPIVTAVIGGVMGTFNGLIGLLTGMLPGAGMIVTGLFDSLGATVSLFTGIFTGMIEIVANLIAGNWTGAWEAAKNTVAVTFDNIKTGIQAALSIVIGIVSTIIGGIVGFFDGAYTSLTGKTSTFRDDVTSFFSTLKDTVVKAVEDLYNGAVKWITDTYTSGVKVFTNMSTEVTTTIETLKTDVVTAVTNMATAIGETATSFFDKAKAIGTELINGIIKGLADAAGKLYNKVRDIVKSAIGAGETEGDIQSPSGETERRIGIPLIQGIIAGITSEEQALINTLQGVIGSMLDQTKLLAENISDDLKKIIGDVQSVAKDFASEIHAMMKESLEAAKGFNDIRIGIIGDTQSLFSFTASGEIENAKKGMQSFGAEYRKLQDDLKKQRVDTEKLVNESIASEANVRLTTEEKIADLRNKLNEKLKDFAADETNPEMIARRNTLIADSEREINKVRDEGNARMRAEMDKRKNAADALAKAERETGFLIQQARANETQSAKNIARFRVAEQKQREIALQAERDIIKAQQEAENIAATDPAKAARVLDQRRKQIIEIAKIDQALALAQAKNDGAEIDRLNRIRALTIRNHKIDQNMLAMTNDEENAKSDDRLQRLNDIAQKITDIFSTGYFSTVGQDVANGITQGILANIGAVSDALTRGMNNALKNLKALLGINSPSKVFAQEIAKPSIQGWAGGLEKLSGMVSNTVGNIGVQSVRALPQPAQAGATTIYNITLDLSGSNLNRSEVESILDRRLDKIAALSRVVKRT